jgi:hypothetical protein
MAWATRRPRTEMEISSSTCSTVRAHKVPKASRDRPDLKVRRGSRERRDPRDRKVIQGLRGLLARRDRPGRTD